MSRGEPSFARSRCRGYIEGGGGEGVPAGWRPPCPLHPSRKKKNKEKPLTSLQKLLLEAISGTLGVRERVARVGQIYGLKAEQAIVMLIVREAFLKGELLNTVEIADRADVDRKVAERALKRLAKSGVSLSEKIGRENVHFTPAGHLDQDYIIDRYLDGVAYLIALGARLSRSVAALDDEKLKARIAEALQKVETTTFAD